MPGTRRPRPLLTCPSPACGGAPWTLGLSGLGGAAVTGHLGGPRHPAHSGRPQTGLHSLSTSKSRFWLVGTDVKRAESQALSWGQHGRFSLEGRQSRGSGGP